MSSRRFRCAVCGAPQTRRRPMFRIDHDPDVWAHVDCASPEAWEAQLRRVFGIGPVAQVEAERHWAPRAAVRGRDPDSGPLDGEES